MANDERAPVSFYRGAAANLVTHRENGDLLFSTGANDEKKISLVIDDNGTVVDYSGYDGSDAFKTTDIIPVTNGGTGVTSIASLKTALGLDGYLPLTGGTLTGPVIMEVDDSPLTLKSNSLDMSATDDSTGYFEAINVVDKYSDRFGRLEWYKTNGYNTGFGLFVTPVDSREYKGLTLNIVNNETFGERGTWTVDYPSSFCSAISAVNTAGDTMTGTLNFNSSNVDMLNIKDTGVDLSLADNNVDSADIYRKNGITFKDTAGRTTTRLESNAYADGMNEFYVFSKNYNTDGSEAARKGIRIESHKDGHGVTRVETNVLHLNDAYWPDPRIILKDSEVNTVESDNGINYTHNSMLVFTDTNDEEYAYIQGRTSTDGWTHLRLVANAYANNGTGDKTNECGIAICGGRNSALNRLYLIGGDAHVYDGSIQMETGDLICKSNNFTLGTTNSFTNGNSMVIFKDVNNVDAAFVCGGAGGNYSSHLTLSAVNVPAGGSKVYNDLRLNVNGDGTRTVGVSETAPWHKGLATPSGFFAYRESSVSLTNSTTNIVLTGSAGGGKDRDDFSLNTSTGVITVKRAGNVHVSVISYFTTTSSAATGYIGARWSNSNYGSSFVKMPTGTYEIAVSQNHTFAAGDTIQIIGQINGGANLGSATRTFVQLMYTD